MSSVNVPNTVYLLTQDRNSKARGCLQATNQLPVLSLTSERGLELMRASGEPTEFGIFDFYKVFSRASGEEDNGAAGT